MLKGAERAAAFLVAVKILPVPSMFTFQGNDAGSVFSWRIAANIGKPPFILIRFPAGEELRHPDSSAITKSRDDGVQIVTNRWRWWQNVIQVNQGSPSLSRLA